MEIVDMTPAVNEVINTGIKNNVVDSKQIKVKFHTTGQLYARNRVTFLCLAAFARKFTFISFKHYDEENDSIENFNDDFIVGAYTPKGVVAYHFKNEFLDEFKDVRHIEKAPFYDGYTEEESLIRMKSLAEAKFSGMTDEEIIDLINSNESLHESQKLMYLKR